MDAEGALEAAAGTGTLTRRGRRPHAARRCHNFPIRRYQRGHPGPFSPASFSSSVDTSASQLRSSFPLSVILK
jgi:hypothetical protein